VYRVDKYELDPLEASIEEIEVLIPVDQKNFFEKLKSMARDPSDD